MAPNLYLLARTTVRPDTWFRRKSRDETAISPDKHLIEHWDSPVPGIYEFFPGRGWFLTQRDYPYDSGYESGYESDRKSFRPGFPSTSTSGSGSGSRSPSASPSTTTPTPTPSSRASSRASSRSRLASASTSTLPSPTTTSSPTVSARSSTTSLSFASKSSKSSSSSTLTIRPQGEEVRYCRVLHQYMLVSEFEARCRWKTVTRPGAGVNGGARMETCRFFRLEDGVSWVRCWDSEGRFIHGPYRKWVVDSETREMRPMGRGD